VKCSGQWQMHGMILLSAFLHCKHKHSAVWLINSMFNTCPSALPIHGRNHWGGRGAKRRGPAPQNLDGPPTFFVAFWWGSGGGSKLRQTGFTFLKTFFWSRAIIPQTKKLDPPTLKTWCAPVSIYLTEA